MTSTARQAFRRAVLEGGPRLVEAMFLCQVSTASEALSGAAQGYLHCLLFLVYVRKFFKVLKVLCKTPGHNKLVIQPWSPNPDHQTLVY